MAAKHHSKNYIKITLLLARGDNSHRSAHADDNKHSKIFSVEVILVSYQTKRLREAFII